MQDDTMSNATETESPKDRRRMAKNKPSGAGDRTESSLNLMTPLSEPHRYLDVYPEDVNIPVDPAHPLYDKRAFDPLDMAICNNIQERGMREPPVVRYKPGTDELEIVDGRTRLRSARFINEALEKAGLPKKKIVVKLEVAESDLSAAMLKHLYNEQRNQRDAYGRAEGMVEMLRLGMDKDDVANLFKVHKRTVSRAKKVVENTTESVKEALGSDKITFVEAIALSEKDEEKQEELLTAILKGKEDMVSFVSGTDEEEAEEEEKPRAKKKQRKSLPWKKVHDLYKGISSHRFNDRQKNHTDSDLANIATLAMDFMGGGGDRARKRFFEALEAIGFQATPEEGGELATLAGRDVRAVPVAPRTSCPPQGERHEDQDPPESSCGQGSL